MPTRQDRGITIHNKEDQHLKKKTRTNYYRNLPFCRDWDGSVPGSGSEGPLLKPRIRYNVGSLRFKIYTILFVYVVYFGQRLGAGHSKPWWKYAFSLNQHSGANSKKQFFYKLKNGMFYHSYLRVGEDISLLHFFAPSF